MLSAKLKFLIIAALLADITGTAMVVSIDNTQREQVRCRAQVAELNYSVADTIAICSGKVSEGK